MLNAIFRSVAVSADWLHSGIVMLPLALGLTIGIAGLDVEAGPVRSLDCDAQKARFLVGDDKVLDFVVEIADDPASRARGLMFRDNLPSGQGMLFIYDRPQVVSFWMENTLIPLDMIFMDARGVIRHIHENAQPLDRSPIPGAAPGDPAPSRLMVLEIAGGDARRLGLSEGTAMAHPRLDQSKAALPCR
ncbi:MAG: DUF192 domain-containing protein [Paracoccus sp. (in: a-proteobacteria)]|nr:DUF192 domain-containing protein [Paracoccus sp. (in: a-proteobacteria)]